MPRSLRMNPLVETRRHAPTCQFPLDDGEGRTPRFCDRPSVGGKSYCAEHAARAFLPLKPPMRHRREYA